MSCVSKLLGVSLGVMMLSGCQATPSRQSGPISLTPGTAEYEMRQDQLRSARGDPGRANQNPVGIGMANPGTDAVGGIQRIPGTGGAAGTSAGNPTAINPSTTGIERRGVGAPY
jgi:hypothetical protein